MDRMKDNEDEVEIEIYLTSSDYELLEMVALHFAEVSDIPRTADNIATMYVHQAIANIKRAMRSGTKTLK